MAARLGEAAVDVLLAHDVLHVPDAREVEAELPAELRLARWQLVARHQLQQVPARAAAAPITNSLPQSSYC